MATKKPTESDYQVLSEIDHVRQRPGMYVGSVSLESTPQWVFGTESKKMSRSDLNIIPGLIKIFSEILDNAIDEHKRAPEILNTIKVDFDRKTGAITVADNGRGFPCKLHEKTGKYIAETVFTNLRAGSNFDDSQDQALIGTNGVGSSLTVILSSAFTVETADGTKLYKQTYTDGMKTIKPPKITDSEKHYTKITFIPDYEYFKLAGLDDDHVARMVKRVVDAAACNTGVKFYIDGDRVMTKNFDDYVQMYLEEGEEFVSDRNTDWSVAISKSHDGHEQISFVNAVETYNGGEHVKYVMNQITEAVRAFIKKKHKIDVLPGDIRNHMRVYISCNINRPRFSSQTKENMISMVSEWKTSWSVPDKFIAKLVKTDIIQNILDWAAAKATAAEAAELRKANKDMTKTDPRKVAKFSDAMEAVDRWKCVLYLSEGDSASKSIQGGRGTNPYIGSFPLKGKISNVRELDIKKILGLDKKDAKKKEEPNEIQKIMTILGLKIGERVEFIDYPDGEWIEMEINGVVKHVNINDSVEVDGKWIKVSTLL